MEEIIGKMIELGWTESEGRIVHPFNGLEFDSWVNAIIACIVIASEE